MPSQSPHELSAESTTKRHLEWTDLQRCNRHVRLIRPEQAGSQSHIFHRTLHLPARMQEGWQPLPDHAASLADGWVCQQTLHGTQDGSTGSTAGTSRARQQAEEEDLLQPEPADGNPLMTLSSTECQ